MRTLVATLLVRQLMRDEIAELLQVGPSGVRKYVTDLGDKIAVARYVDASSRSKGEPLYCLAMTPEAAHAFMATLEVAPAPRSSHKSTSALSVARRDPKRCIHVMDHDEHYSIRLSRAPAVRDPLVAALFGARGAEVRA